MRIDREHEFKPVVITLETEEELNTFRDLLNHGSRKRPNDQKEMAMFLDNAICNFPF